MSNLAETGSKNKKKKKKKGGGSTQEAEPPKKKSGASSKLALLRERLAAQKEAEEELERQRLAEIAAQKEEEDRIAKEEAAIVEAKLRKKEKEKAKRDELKKQGKYLTPAQKVLSPRLYLRLLKKWLKSDLRLLWRQGVFKLKALVEEVILDPNQRR